MLPHQRVNHFPGIYNLARKNMLGRHLMKMQQLLPDEYNFFPTTYMLPHDYNHLIEDQRDQKHPRTFIVKPEDSCQGKGIFLTRNIADLKATDQLVVQKYIHKPHLIDNFKYDLRVYVILTGVNPLRVYVYKDGLARFATAEYEKPSDKNCKNLFMHLTNYAINKESENFVQSTKNNEDVASKRSMINVLEGIGADSGEDALDKLKIEIYDLIIKSLSMATS